MLLNSYILPCLQRLKLQTNMKVRLHGDLNAGRFAVKLLIIGNGNILLDTEGEISFLQGCGVQVKTLDDLISKVYPNIKQKLK